MENLTFSILNAVSTDIHFMDLFLHIIPVEGHFDVMIALNVHTMREKTCLVTKRHADRRGKPLFFTHKQLSYFLDHKNNFFSPEKSCIKCCYVLWSERCMALHVAELPTLPGGMMVMIT
jgi:hypothetical protein